MRSLTIRRPSDCHSYLLLIDGIPMAFWPAPNKIKVSTHKRLIPYPGLINHSWGTTANLQVLEIFTAKETFSLI